MKTIHPTRCAFSVVELLVVVAIIAVLAGLLLPAIGAVRRVAAVSVCAANLRQVATISLTYAGEWRGVLPTQGNPTNTTFFNHLGLTSWSQKLWEMQEHPLARDFNAYASASGHGVAETFLKGTAMSCPTTWRIYRHVRRTAGTDYALNRFLGYRYPGLVGTPSTPRVQHLSSSIYWFADAPGLDGNSSLPPHHWSGLNPWMWTNEAAGRQHNNVANVVYGDGRVHGMRKQEHAAFTAEELQLFTKPR